eukprot:10244737-Lingulodinium_polyedra.AAC.1
MDAARWPQHLLRGNLVLGGLQPSRACRTSCGAGSGAAVRGVFRALLVNWDLWFFGPASPGRRRGRGRAGGFLRGLGSFGRVGRALRSGGPFLTGCGGV